MKTWEQQGIMGTYQINTIFVRHLKMSWKLTKNIFSSNFKFVWVISGENIFFCVSKVGIS